MRIAELDFKDFRDNAAERTQIVAFFRVGLQQAELTWVSPDSSVLLLGCLQLHRSLLHPEGHHSSLTADKY